jgi:hypothetical protein
MVGAEFIKPLQSAHSEKPAGQCMHVSGVGLAEVTTQGIGWDLVAGGFRVRPEDRVTFDIPL